VFPQYALAHRRSDNSPKKSSGFGFKTIMPAATLPLDFQSIVIVKLSDDERISEQLTLENMGIAISAFHRDGVVVLENAVDLEHVDKLNAILSVDALEMAKLPTTHFNDVSAVFRFIST
jgi:hypothetical protein